jgi:hypothetical protein
MLGVAVIACFAVSSVLAAPIDFSTDPQLSTDWTQYYFYNALGQSQVGAAWNEANQNLDLTATNEEGLGGLFKTSDLRSATDGVTVTYSNYVSNTPTVTANWTCAGLVVSTSATPGIFDDPTGWYGVYFQRDFTNGMYLAAGKGLTQLGNKVHLDAIPSTIKLDILHDGSEWVFKANGMELARDSSFAASAMPHYMMYWGGGGSDTLSVSADNFGVVPEPSSIVLLVGAVLGLAAYAWRKRK